MKNEILITDTLFIFPEHEAKIKSAGYDIVRFPKPNATEGEMCELIKGKVGYVLGGLEKVTENVIAAADKLKVIAFTGADATSYVPAMTSATKKGISISATPGANSFAVAEYTTAVILAMTRNIFELGRTGEKKFETTKSIREEVVGIVGLGNIGTRVAKNLLALGAKKVLYWNRTRKPEIEQMGIEYVDSIEALLRRSDIVSLHVSKDIGSGYITKERLAMMKTGSLIVNCGFTGSIDNEALFHELNSGRLRAMQDDFVDDRFKNLPLHSWFCSNSPTAYNTFEANRVASDMATESLLNLLQTGTDKQKVN